MGDPAEGEAVEEEVGGSPGEPVPETLFHNGLRDVIQRGRLPRDCEAARFSTFVRELTVPLLNASP